MIPQNFKDILANTDYAGFYQTLSMIIFLFFLLFSYFIFSQDQKNFIMKQSVLPSVMINKNYNLYILTLKCQK